MPAAPYGLHWLLVVLILGALVTANELHWRARGAVPSVADTPAYWSIIRRGASHGDHGKTLVITGASRAQLGLVPDVLRRELPVAGVAHLAINASSPWSVVRDLCLDEEFSGIILASMRTQWLLATAGESASDRAEDFVATYHRDIAPRRFVEKRFNTVIGGWLQSRAVTLSQALTLRQLARTRFQPEALYLAMRLDRYRPAHYLTKVTPVRLNEQRRRLADLEARDVWVPTRDAFEHRLDRLEELHEALRSRGGQMILVRMPTTGELWERDEQRAPKAEYWDRITDLTGVHTIHFADYEQLRAFDCPDTSHLDASDAPEFTRKLSAIISQELDL